MNGRGRSSPIPPALFVSLCWSGKGLPLFIRAQCVAMTRLYSATPVRCMLIDLAFIVTNPQGRSITLVLLCIVSALMSSLALV